MNIATFTDPRYKELPFLDRVTKARVVKQVEDELLDMDTHESVEDQTEQQSPAPKRAKKGPMAELFGDLFTQSAASNPVHSEEVSRELSLYQAEKAADLDSDPLTWWYTHKQVYPLMSKLAQHFFPSLQQVFPQSVSLVPQGISSQASVVA